MGKAYSPRPCLHCDRVHTLRGDYCGMRCRVAAWRGRYRVVEDIEDDQDQDQGDIEYHVTPTGRLLVVDEVEGTRVMCAHVDCVVLLPKGTHAKFCCNAHRQDAYRLRKAGMT